MRWVRIAGCLLVLGGCRRSEAPVVAPAVAATPAVRAAPRPTSEPVTPAPPGFDDPERDEAALQDALAADPGDLKAYEALAWLYYRRSQTQPSYVLIVREVLVQAEAVELRVGRQSADLLATRGLMQVDAGRPDVGLATLEAAVRIDPGHLRAQFAIGDLSRRTRNDARARDAFAAIVGSPMGRRDVESWLSLGAAESRLGHVAAAERAYAEVLRLAPDEPRVRYNLALLHLRRLRDVPAEQHGVALGRGLQRVEEFLTGTAADRRYAERRTELLDLLVPLALAYRSDSALGKRMLRLIDMVGDAEMISAVQEILRVRESPPEECGKRLPCPGERERLLELERREMAAEQERARLLKLERDTLDGAGQ